MAKSLAANNVTQSNRSWIRGYTIAGFILFITYQFLLPWDGLPSGIYKSIYQWMPPSAVNESLVYVIMALGLNIVVGYAGLLDLGYVAFWAIGGYCAGWFMSEFFYFLNINIFGSVPAGTPGIHINFWMVLIIGGFVCALFGVLIGAPTLRLKGDYLALVTLGFGEIIPQVFFNGENVFGYNISNGTKGIVVVDPIPAGFKDLGPFDAGWRLLLFLFLTTIMVFISLRLRRGRLGRAWLAVREDELAASMMGVPLMRTKLASYAVGAFAGGLGGVAFATHVNGVYAERFNFAISIFLLAMVVLGGMGNVWGVILGAFLLSWINGNGLSAFGRVYNDSFGTSIDFTSFTFLLFGLVLVLMMLFKREGLIPESRMKLLMHEEELDDAESVGKKQKAGK
jgi:branched-chain amino acid transport system permease protein|uniref:branched-chain amino acid ABC transporter permease n=1 Tax=Candidatus Nanopelagicus sp. TaxID=2518620 RepID=UPI00404987FE